MEEENKKILIIDDDENLRTVLIDKLNISGFSAKSAINGKEGLEKAIESHPDLILLDVMMPIMDGWEVLEELRKDDWGKTAKVIMLTVLDDAEAISKAVIGGTFSYIIKSEQSIEEIVEKVKEMLK